MCKVDGLAKKMTDEILDVLRQAFQVTDDGMYSDEVLNLQVIALAGSLSTFALTLCHFNEAISPICLVNAICKISLALLEQHKEAQKMN